MPTSPMLEKAEASLSRTADEHSSVPSASASTQRLQITDPVIVAWPDHRISDHMLARPRPDVVPYQHSQSSNWPNLRPRLGPHAPGNARSRAQVLDELTWHYQNLPRERLRELGIIPPALPIRDSRGHDGIPIGKPITFQSRGISLAHQRAVWKARSGSGRNAARNPGSPLRPRHRQSDVHYTDDFHNDYQYCNGPACHVTVFRRPPGFHPSQLSPAQFKTVAEHGFLENSQFVNRMGDADHWKALQRVHGVSSERVHPTRSENHYYVGHIDRRGLGEDVGVLVKLKEKHTREQPERAAEGKAMLTASEARASRRASEGRMGASKDHAPAASARTPDFGIGAVRSDKGASDDHAAAEKVHLDAAPLRMPGPTIVALPPEAMVPLGKSVSRIPQVSETPSLPQLQAVTEGLRGEASSSRASLSSKLRAASGEEHDAAAAAEPDGRRNLEALRISGYPHPVNVVGRPVVIHRSMLSPTSREALLYHQGPPPKPDGVRLEVSQQPATGKVVLFGRPPHFNPRTLSPNSRKVMKDSGLERDGGIAPYKPPHSH
ncbi:hypothetical protein IE81DRAFT_321443 [Ceraceosorus guamensis]|uniref:Uncharacterized protein n=1 Tax=Ceraceosorus guamensis TaxID=1522189 RepID=A0A316W8C1_9BASI|nr:hypothetical protein IE81DRAFT_321443 [Ceraceosorus guamensis]PWN44293.1 hypothetical protein IE81DRAFT_321443 [Ceraceosorus guamensis]